VRQFDVELNESHLVCRQVFFGINGVDRALGNADGAVNALVRVYHQHVRAFAETVHRANIHTVGVLATDTGFRNDVGHVVGAGR
jgi:hypothetical protein